MKNKFRNPHAKAVVLALLLTILAGVGTIEIRSQLTAHKTLIPTATPTVSPVNSAQIETRAQFATSPKIIQSPMPSPTKNQHNLVEKSIEELNPSRSRAFYFLGEDGSFVEELKANKKSYPFNIGETNYSKYPFEICFNGDTLYSTPGYNEPNNYNKIISPRLVDLSTNKVTELTSINKISAPNGCVRVTDWLDDERLLVEEWAGDVSLFYEYTIIDYSNQVLQQTSKVTRGIGISTDDESLIRQGGEVVHIASGAITIVQYCKKENECRNIEIYKDLPAQSWEYPINAKKPADTINSSRQMDLLIPNKSNTSTVANDTIEVSAGDVIYRISTVTGEILAK